MTYPPPQPQPQIQPQIQPQPHRQPPPTPRRGRGLVVLIVVLVVLAGLLVGGDQVARSVAQTVVAGRAQERLGSTDEPTVEIRGYPFLTQALTGRYDAVHVSAATARLSIDRNTISVEQVDATAYDIVATDRLQRIVAGRAELSALVPYAAASTLTGLKLGAAGDGRVKVTFELPFGGQQVVGSATGRPVLDADNQRISFTDITATIGNGTEISAEAIGRLVLGPIPLEKVPYGLRLTALSAEDGGLRLAATGVDVPLRG